MLGLYSCMSDCNTVSTFLSAIYGIHLYIICYTSLTQWLLYLWGFYKISIWDVHQNAHFLVLSNQLPLWCLRMVLSWSRAYQVWPSKYRVVHCQGSLIDGMAWHGVGTEMVMWLYDLQTGENKYILLMHCIKIESFVKFIFNIKYPFIYGFISL